MLFNTTKTKNAFYILLNYGIGYLDRKYILQTPTSEREELNRFVQNSNN